MKNPTIMHRIVQYDDRLWVLRTALPRPNVAGYMLNLVDGEETVSVPVTSTDYDAIMASCPLQVFKSEAQ